MIAPPPPHCSAIFCLFIRRPNLAALNSARALTTKLAVHLAALFVELRGVGARPAGRCSEDNQDDSH